MHNSHAVVAEQFDDRVQQHEASNLGMWIFLATEIMFFGGLFTGYTIYRNLYTSAFETASHLLNAKLGAFNTAVLICSSLTMALAVHAAQTGKRKRLITYLLSTMALGLVFIYIKFILEWHHDFVEGLAPGLHFTYTGPHASRFGTSSRRGGGGCRPAPPAPEVNIYNVWRGAIDPGTHRYKASYVLANGRETRPRPASPPNSTSPPSRCSTALWKRCSPASSARCTRRTRGSARIWRDGSAVTASARSVHGKKSC